VNRVYQGCGVNPSSSESKVTQIPKALRDLPRWMGTRFERKRDGRVDKPPYCIRPGSKFVKSDKTDPANWCTFEEATSALGRGDVDDIGFVFTDEDPFFVVDLDGVVDRESGEINASAAEIIHTMASYTEISCSGTGVHVVGIGTKPEFAGCKSMKLGFTAEVYDSSRFMVMTGQSIARMLDPETKKQDELEWLCQRLWIKHERFNSRPQAESRAADLEDEALLDRARNARTGAKFVRLFDQGDASEFGSQSEADFALLNMLVFWTAGDPLRMADLFERSELYRRDKHRNYVRDSVAKALASYKGAFYQPRDIRKARKEDSEDPLTPYLKVLLDPSVWTGRKGASAYKTYTALVILADEYGVTDDNGDLRIGCDTRRIAEVAGTRQATVCQTALPYLVKDMKLIRWKKGKGANASVLILPKKGACIDRITKVSTHFSDTVCVDPSEALKILRLFIRMRAGHAKAAILLRLGMPAMFVAIALAGAGRRGYTREELAERTGRRASTLDRPGVEDTPLKRLKAAGIIQESEGCYRLSKSFASRYEHALEFSGVTYTEREQRRRHEEDRRRRDAKIPTDQQQHDLKGAEHNARILRRNRERERERWVEEQRQKVGTTAATFLDDELEGVVAVSFQSLKRRFHERGGKLTDLHRAIYFGPWEKYRERDGDLYVRVSEDGSSRRPDDPEESLTNEQGIERLVKQGMSRRWAGAEVLGEDLL
jgi:hypothetical protein